jgi:hypothetical protein
MVQESLGARGIALRLLAALLLVLLTFNPSGYSYLHWLVGEFPHVSALAVAAGLGLLMCWIVFLGATMQSLGIGGVLLLLAFFAALAWTAVNINLLNVGSGHALAWVALVVTGLILGVGTCWSHLRRRLTGQTDVEEVDVHH